MKNILSGIFLILFFATSCATSKSGAGVKSDINSAPLEKSEKSKKINTKKLTKEAAYMVGWDIVLAAGCKAGLHFSVGICLAADIMGDASIIAYNNIMPDNKKDKSGADLTKEVAKEKSFKEKFKESFNPLEFLIGVGLMTVTLVLI